MILPRDKVLKMRKDDFMEKVRKYVDRMHEKGVEQGAKDGVKYGEKHGSRNGYDVGLSEGEEIGRRKVISEVVKAMRKNGMNDSQIAKLTGIPLYDISDVKKRSRK